MIEKFIKAFNAGDLAALKALLAPDATAQVMGAPFPVEHGPDLIAATSLPHMLGGAGRLKAEQFEDGGKEWLLFRAPDGSLDTVATIVSNTGQISRIEYFVTHFAAETLRRIAAARGIEVRAE